MTITIKNVGAMQYGPQGQQNTGGGAVSKGDQGTVRVIYQNREFVFGPNQTRTFQDDGIGLAVAAQDTTRLRIVGTREASVIGNPSLTLRT